MRLVALASALTVALGLGLVSGCSDESDAPATDEPTPTDEGGTTPGPHDGDAGTEDGAVTSACPRVAKPDEHVRRVVVSHPFTEGSEKGKVFEVLELSTAGALTKTGVTFEMGPAYAPIAFTPDGEVGIVAQEDGTLGVFAFDAAGKVRVVHAAFKGDFYASDVVISRDGTRAFVLDSQTKSNGGGVHQVSIGCDGTLRSDGLVVDGEKAHAMALVPSDPDRAILIAGAALGSPADTYAHRLDLSGAKPVRLASGSVFGDGDAIASSVAVTLDGKFALVSDDGLAVGNRIAAIALSDMTPRPAISTPAPAGVVMSPFGNALLLLNADGQDALRTVTYDPTNDQAPFAITTQIATAGGKTELPSIARVIERGTLKGRVLVAEVQKVRQLAFSPNGTIADVDASIGFDGSTGIVGSLGVEP